MPFYDTVPRVPESLSSSANDLDVPLGGWEKRAFDIVFSLCALLAVAVPFLFIAVFLKIFSPGPVFFGHQRVGHNGENSSSA